MAEELPASSPVSRAGLWHHRLVRELTLVAAIKLVLLFALWFAFFRQPGVHPPGSTEVSAALLGTAQTPHPSLPADEPASSTGMTPW